MNLKQKLALLKDAGPGSRQSASSVKESAARAVASPPSIAAEQPRSRRTPVDEGGDDGARERNERLEKLRGLIRHVMEREAPRPRPAVGATPRSREAPKDEGGPRTNEQGEPLPLDDDGRRIDVSQQSLPGAALETPHGEVHVAEEHLEPAHCQGRVAVASALEVSSWAMAHLAVDSGLEAVDFRKMLFLDTETTGLVGGTGTVPFLVGVAYFEDESLCVEQLFLRQLGHERPLLYRLTELLERSTALVTYNGKTFDWPLLRTRYVMNQLPPPPELPHLDLLHCARRVLRRRLGTLRLVHLEEHILGMRREDDVEGAEIPIRYLDYLRSGNEGQLVPVIEHNAHDLVSLAAVMGWLGSHYERCHSEDEPDDHLSYAKVARRIGDFDRALEFAGAARAGGGDSKVCLEADLLIADIYRLRGDSEGQERALQRALEVAGYVGETAAPVHLKLAKLYEHKVKDLQRALRHAEHSAAAETPEDGEHRRARIRERIEREALRSTTKSA